MDAFKKAEDPKKIEMFGNYLKDEARTWFHQVDWKDIVFGDEHTPGSFVHRFLNKFLNVTTIYHLRMLFDRRQQGPYEDAITYMKEKLKLYKKFAKIDASNESTIVADMVQGLTMHAQRVLRSIPSSIEDLQAQFAQTDWMNKEELRQSILPYLHQEANGSNPTFGNVTSNIYNTTSMLPSSVWKKCKLEYTLYEESAQSYSTCVTCLESRVKMFFQATMAGFRRC
jgi:DNA-directed RNA polymerase subunit F